MIHFLKKIKPSFIICLSLFLIAFLFRLFLVSISDNMWGADPDEKIRICSNWLELGPGRLFYVSDLWLPLHLYLMALIIKIFNNLNIALRFLHVIIGCISVIPFYALVKLVFNQRVALFSSILFIFYPIHVLCSIVTLSEIVFLLCLLSYAYFYFQWHRTDKNIHFFLLILFFILSTMVRYEGWILIPIVSIFLIVGKKQKAALIFFIATLIFPLFWSLAVKEPVNYAMQYINLKNTLDFLKNIHINFYWAKVLAEYFSMPLMIISVLGVLFLYREKKIFFFILPLTLFLFFTYGISAHPLEDIHNYSLSFSIFLIPLVVHGLLEILNKARPFKKYAPILAVSIILVFFIRTSLDLIRIYPDYINNIAVSLRYKLTRHDKVLLYNHNFELNHSPVLVGSPTRRFTIAGKGGDMLLDKDSIANYIKENRPRYIVHSREGELSMVFIDSMTLKRIAQSSDFSIYEARYGDT